MYKIAILGCENSHADAFLSLIKDGAYPEIEVAGVYSNETEAAKKLSETYGVKALSDFSELRGKLDGVMITARHGDNHYKYARPYMDDGIPMFIDKPITVSESDADAFMNEAKAKNIRFCGGSTCAALGNVLELKKDFASGALGDRLGGNLVCPIHVNNPYGGFFFYTQHLAEVMLTVFGGDVKSVIATNRGDRLSLIAEYPDFDVTATYLDVGYYQISAYGSKCQKTITLDIGRDSFRHEMDDMLDLLHGGGMKKSYADFALPVFLINAIYRSFVSGKREAVGRPSV